MTVTPTPELLDSLYWTTIIAVVVASASGALKAGFKEFDLFGVMVCASATGLGGGSLRDILLSSEIFWVTDQVFFAAAVGSGIVVFITARLVVIPPNFLLYPDAAGLATFGVAGTLVAMMAGVDWLVASFLGMMTGTIGGIFRDMLCNETPAIFNGPLYASVSWVGCLIFIGFMYMDMDIAIACIASGVLTFAARIIAFHYDISLPQFSFKR